MAVCINYKARHWEYKRSKSTGHYSTCCSQGKVQLSPLSGPIPSIDSCLKARIPALKDPACFGYFDAFTIDSAPLGAMIPAVIQRPTFAKTWLICPAEATDTQLGPDGADSRIQRSTLTKLDSTLRTGNRLVRELASAKARAG
ncbi:BQ5605_C011g06304 [Microbotryum silenes-dioicae]|uniref:BQ5605_C011g06304 protein n=2 Tax=Microbotryum silenes-dioicae TaxID=796604 RepID=A0A2X0NKX8_9BASI|nr:BQ5605_C011g06304 [Microbotryum silenes-dioicae]